MLSFIKEEISVWDMLKNTTKPIVLYGMGNGADKIIDWCEKSGVQVQGVFASDEFVRGQAFRGFTVERYDKLVERLGSDLLIVIAFASELPEVLERFALLNAAHQVVAPHLALFDEEETVSAGWLEKYESKLQQVYDNLADDQSRRVFAAALNYKLSGKISYLLDCETNRQEDLQSIFTWGEDESCLDLGAYNGDTVEEFGQLVGWRWQHVTAVEPDRRSCRKLRLLAEKLQGKGLAVDVVEAGSWSEKTILSFSDSGGRQSTFIGAQKREVEVTTIDELAAGERVTYIKMDVEGAEAQTIQGGQGTIRSWMPKLFIAAYHYDVDLFRLPLLLWELAPDYKIYLRKHPYVPAWELNFLVKE